MGRDKHNEKMPSFTPALHRTVDSPAWLALTVYAKALYPIMKRRAGVHGSKNGQFSLSVREAADLLGCNRNTVTKAFHDLQAKGFAFPVKIGVLGSNGFGNASQWRVTDIATPINRRPTCEFMEWQEGHDFPVQRGKAPPKKQKPVLLDRQACPTR